MKQYTLKGDKYATEGETTKSGFVSGTITAEEILGLNGLNSILNYAKLQKFIGAYPANNLELEQSSEDFSRLMAGFIEVLGERGSKSITFQLGKRSFEIILEQFPSLLNIDGIMPDERTPERLFDEFVRLQGIMFVAAEQLFGDIYTCYENDEGYVIELSPCYGVAGLRRACRYAMPVPASATPSPAGSSGRTCGSTKPSASPGGTTGAATCSIGRGHR